MRYCGVCHLDIPQVENDWGNPVYPCMPGHKVGDLVGVGCMIDSCRSCEPCREGDEHHCEGHSSWLATYNGPMKPAAQTDDGINTYLCLVRDKSLPGGGSLAASLRRIKGGARNGAGRGAVSKAPTGRKVLHAAKPPAGRNVCSAFDIGLGLGSAYGIAAEFRPSVT